MRIHRFPGACPSALPNTGHACKRGTQLVILPFPLHPSIRPSRRFVWNFFRLENEHLNNCGEFRAVRDISVAPLNADDLTLLDQMMDQEDGVRNRRKNKQWKRSLSVSLRRPRLASQYVWPLLQQSPAPELLSVPGGRSRAGNHGLGILHRSQPKQSAKGGQVHLANECASLCQGISLSFTHTGVLVNRQKREFPFYKAPPLLQKYAARGCKCTLEESFSLTRHFGGL